MLVYDLLTLNVRNDNIYHKDFKLQKRIMKLAEALGCDHTSPLPPWSPFKIVYRYTTNEKNI